MSQRRRNTIMLALMGLFASLLWAIAPASSAQAAEYIPPLKWAPPVTPLTPDIGRRSTAVTSPTGSVTLPCFSLDTGWDLQTYSASGQLIQQLDRTSQIDEVQNCISTPVVDKNGVVYGFPSGVDSNGNPRRGSNLLAYNGNTLKWRYPLTCGWDQGPSVVVGANGNIYATASLSDGIHLIGIAPDLQSGETQPAKVMDVKIPDDCSIQLQAYKDGIVVHGQSSGNARYYSYGGKFLGQATIGDIWAERINAEGQLFVGQYVSGSGGTQYDTVSMYDPRRGNVAWTTQVSTPNADPSSTDIYPLPNGKLLVLFYEKRVDGGTPSPTEYAYKLVTLDALGQKSEQVQLPNTDTNGNPYANSPRVSAMANGKALVMREVRLATDTPSQTVPGIAIGVFDPVAESWGYQQVMKGETIGSSGSYTGYSVDYYATANGTLYLVPDVCSPWYCFPGTTLYPLGVLGADIDYPRGAVLTANTSAQPAPRSYVALGDSFSSGEGVPPFDDDGTTCHRSLDAYSRTLSRDPNTSLQLGNFAACSGATTQDVWNSQLGQGQVDVLSAGDPRVATITIGGNDIGFAGFATACVVGGVSTCNFSSQPYQDTLNAINTILASNLEATYKQILDATKTAGTKIYVLGYPQVVADKAATDPYDTRCGFMYDYNRTPSDPWQEARAARDIVTRLNSKITDTVQAVRALDPDNQRLEFVSATAPGSPFSGHEMCSTGESYFQNLDQYPSNNAAPFHPNQDGQAAYAQLIQAAIGE